MSISYKKVGLFCAATLIGAVLSAMPLSVECSTKSGIELSVDQAHAIIGRPATPGSVAGVNRRVHRRAYRRGYYGYYR